MSLRLPRDWARSHPLPATVLGIHPPRSAEVSSRSGEIVRDRPRSSSRRLGRSGGGRTSSPWALRCAACRPGRCLFPTGSCRPLTEWGGSPTPSSGGAQSLERIADPHKPSLSLPLALPHPRFPVSPVCSQGASASSSSRLTRSCTHPAPSSPRSPPSAPSCTARGTASPTAPPPPTASGRRARMPRRRCPTISRQTSSRSSSSPPTTALTTSGSFASSGATSDGTTTHTATHSTTRRRASRLR
mmetsp:Transcript_25778/g.76187  ORF Transcript_25778/g.76187 Transcript_25778/m.76187 type:complete len:244 (+) Transcript_25778:774-1505(+)